VNKGSLPDPLHNFHAIPVDFFNTAHFAQRDRVCSICGLLTFFNESRFENFLNRKDVCTEAERRRSRRPLSRDPCQRSLNL
jgi:hypothetical protein